MRHNYNVLPSTGKMCDGKVCYIKKLAETLKNRFHKEKGRELRIYECPKCNYWHLTHEL